MDKEYYGVSIDYEEARQLADIFLILTDIKHVKLALERLIKLQEEKSDDATLAAALFISALVTYARCFASGKRCGLTPDIFKSIENGNEAHEYFINLRNKHIAHSVNPFEQVKVDLQLSPPENMERKVEGVATYAIKLTSLENNNLKNLMILANHAISITNKKFRLMQDAVINKGKSLPIDDLYKKKRSRIYVPGPDNAKSAKA